MLANKSRPSESHREANRGIVYGAWFQSLGRFVVSWPWLTPDSQPCREEIADGWELRGLIPSAPGRARPSSERCALTF